MNYASFTIGFLAGLLLAVGYAMVQLAMFASSDLEGFRRWLDKMGTE